MSHAVFAGSFDPFTLGHLDLVERALVLFDRVTVLLALNGSKTTLMPRETRLEAIRQSLSHLPGAVVDSHAGLVYAYARSHGATALLRGVRGAADLEFETALAQLNRQLSGGLDTVFLPAAGNHLATSSTFVRELFRHGDEYRAFVPAPVADALEALRITGDSR